MSEIILDANKVKSYVLPNIDKAKQSAQTAYSNANTLRNSVPTAFNYRGEINNILSEIHTIRDDITTIKNNIEAKVEVTTTIERTSNNKMSSISALAASIGTVTPEKLGTIVSKPQNAIKQSEVIQPSEKNSTNNTASKTTSGGFYSSLMQKSFAMVDDLTKTCSTIVGDTKNIMKYIDNNKTTTLGWVADGFDAAIDWGKNALKKTGAFIADVGSAIGSGIKAVWNWATDGDSWKKLGASISNAVISFSKGVVSLVESLGDFAILVGSGASTLATGVTDIAMGLTTGDWDWGATKSLWDRTKSTVSYEWTNELSNLFYQTEVGKTLNSYAYAPFKSDGTGCKIVEGVGYIAGVIGLTIATCGSGNAVLTAGGTTSAGTSAGITVGAGAANVTGATFTVTTSAITSGGIATAAGIGKNTSAAWNDGAGITSGLLYGVAKGGYEGFEMTLGHAINSLKVFKGAGVGRQIGNTASHVFLDTIDGGSGAVIDPLFSMIYAPNQKNMDEIMYYVNYDADGNKINDKTWNDLSFGEKYSAMFQYKGGWNSVKTQALTAGTMSLLSEVPDLSGAWKASKVVKKVSKEGITEATTSSISKLKGKSLPDFIEQSSANGTLSVVADSLSVKQVQGVLKELDNVTANSLLDNLSDVKFRELTSSMDVQTLEKILSTDGLSFESRKKVIDTADALLSGDIEAIETALKNSDAMSVRRALSKMSDEQFENFVKNEALNKLGGDYLTNLTDNLFGDRLTTFFTSMSKEPEILTKMLNNISPNQLDNIIVSGTIGQIDSGSLRQALGDIETERLVSVISKTRVEDDIMIDLILKTVQSENIEKANAIFKNLQANQLNDVLVHFDKRSANNIPLLVNNVFGNDLDDIIKKVSDGEVLFSFVNSVSNQNELMRKLSIDQVKDMFSVADNAYTKQTLISMISVDQAKSVLKDISLDELDEIAKTIYWKEDFAKLFVCTTSLDQVKCLVNSSAFKPFVASCTIMELVKNNFDVSEILKQIQDDDVLGSILFDIPTDFKVRLFGSIQNPDVLKKVINNIKAKELIEILDDTVSGSQVRYSIAKSLNDNQLITCLEGLKLEDTHDLLKFLNAEQISHVSKNLDGVLKIDLANKYGWSVLFDKKTDSLVRFGRIDMIEKFKNRLSAYVDINRIKSLGETYKLYASDRFKKVAVSENSMAFNNGKHSIMNMEYNEGIIKSNISHESIHQISSNDGKGLDGFWHNKRGLSVDNKNIGINECATEYINELVMGDDYYTKMTGEIYCGYQDAVKQLKRLVDGGIVDTEKLLESYFSNDISYLENVITTAAFGNKDVFNKVMTYFDDAIVDDRQLHKESLNKLDKIITVLLMCGRSI